VSELEIELDAIATESAFSGVVRVDDGDAVQVAKAYGLAHRGYGVPNQVDTRFGVASGTKGLTVLTVASLIEDGVLGLSTAARSLLGEDLPLIGDDVTVEHLLSHRSGIGDYLDEEVDHDLSDYLMPAPCTSSPRRSSTWQHSMDIRASSPLASGSPTATAATLSWL
jgi:CubicO group peptidase (beta-lactamase class C family)